MKERLLDIAQIQTKMLRVAEIGVKGLAKVLKADPSTQQDKAIAAIIEADVQEIAKQLVARGNNSVLVSSLLLINMLGAYSPDENEYLEILFAHHILEVISDGLDKDEAFDFNDLAIRLANGNLNINDLEADDKYKSLTEKVGARESNFLLNERPLALISALNLNLKAVAMLKNLANTFTPDLCLVTTKALVSRYQSSEDINSKGYANMSSANALENRAGSILIEVTLWFVSKALAESGENPDLKDALEHKVDDLQQLFGHVAVTIGLLNDLGTSLLTDKSFREEFIAWLRKKHNALIEEQEHQIPSGAEQEQKFLNLRELFIALGAKNSFASVSDTQQMLEDFSDFAGGIEKKKLIQVFKDLFNNESNLFLDSNREADLDIIEFVEQLLEQLVAVFNQSIEKIIELAKILGIDVSKHAIMALIFHEAVYSLTDYYDNTTPQYKLKLIQMQMEKRLAYLVAAILA